MVLPAEYNDVRCFCGRFVGLGKKAADFLVFAFSHVGFRGTCACAMWEYCQKQVEFLCNFIT